MTLSNRSACPINLAVEILGDRWTLLVLRDIMFHHRSHFRALLEGSDEGISPSILSDRLQSLVASGILTRENCTTHRQKSFYRLTQAGADLVPVMVQLGAWGARYQPADPDLCGETRALLEGGDNACCQFKERLLEAAGAEPHGST